MLEAIRKIGIGSISETTCRASNARTFRNKRSQSIWSYRVIRQAASSAGDDGGAAGADGAADPQAGSDNADGAQCAVESPFEGGQLPAGPISSLASIFELPSICNSNCLAPTNLPRASAVVTTEAPKAR